MLWMSQLLRSLQERNGGDPIPMVVRTTIEHLEKTGLSVEGIFRRTTAHSIVKRVKAQLNEGIKIIHKYINIAKHCFINILFCYTKNS